MHNDSLKKFLEAVVHKYGDIEYYGSNPEEVDGACFKANGIDATFSVISTAVVDVYNIQVEGSPTGDYIYADKLSLVEFLQVMVRFEGPASDWP